MARYTQIFFLYLLLAALPNCGGAYGQKGRPDSKNPPRKRGVPAAIPDYYRIVGLGSTGSESKASFPFPTVILRVKDTVNTRITVRFPMLGLLGIQEDTSIGPDFTIGDSLQGFQPPDPLYQLTFPKTQYEVVVDVRDKNTGRLLDSRPLPYDMNVLRSHGAHFDSVYSPTTGLGSPTLRRNFQPQLLPFSIGSNPGWGVTETLDTSGIYALVFRNPSNPDKLELSLTMRPAAVGRIDSANWENFKDKARIAFGSRGVAVSSIGDFQVDDIPTRSVIRAGYEFVSKQADSSMEYVASYLTPRAIMLLIAPLDEENLTIEYAYFRGIARSLKLTRTPQ